MHGHIEAFGMDQELRKRRMQKAKKSYLCSEVAIPTSERRRRSRTVYDCCLYQQDGGRRSTLCLSR